MVLFKFWMRSLSGPHLCVDAGRWVFEVCRHHIGFTEQRRSKDDGHWEYDCQYYWIAWAWPPRWWGYAGSQYDGFHETLGIGPMCLTWSNSFDRNGRTWPWDSMGSRADE